MNSIRLLAEAEEELVSIVSYVRENHGTRVANRVYNEIMERISHLSLMPDLGTLDTTLHYRGKPVRILHSRHTRIIYSVRESEIVILLFWDNRRDEHKLHSAISSRL